MGKMGLHKSNYIYIYLSHSECTSYTPIHVIVNKYKIYLYIHVNMNL